MGFEHSQILATFLAEGAKHLLTMEVMLVNGLFEVTEALRHSHTTRTASNARNWHKALLLLGVVHKQRCLPSMMKREFIHRQQIEKISVLAPLHLQFKRKWRCSRRTPISNTMLPARPLPHIHHNRPRLCQSWRLVGMLRMISTCQRHALDRNRWSRRTLRRPPFIPKLRDIISNAPLRIHAL